MVKEKKNRTLNIYLKGERTRSKHVGGLVSGECKISLKSWGKLHFTTLNYHPFFTSPLKL